MTGNFFVLGFDGKEKATKTLLKISGQSGLGGVILFDRNIESSRQLRELTSNLRTLSPIISIDQEGGGFQRLKAPEFVAYPRACDVTLETAYDVGNRMGRELASLGINMDNAPVLDVNSNLENPIIGVRSFGPDPLLVAEVGQRFIQGLHESGVLACGKHFPGHGDTSQDSHLTLPTVDHPRERLEKIEFHPFRALIREGLKCLMTAHVVYLALDPDRPATFSEIIVTDILRKEWGYRGLVITDDMGMAGAASQGDLAEVCLSAFAAGCDLILVCDHHERHEEIVAKFGQAVSQSDFLQKRCAESLERIERVKQLIRIKS